MSLNTPLSNIIVMYANEQLRAKRRLEGNYGETYDYFCLSNYSVRWLLRNELNQMLKGENREKSKTQSQLH